MKAFFFHIPKTGGVSIVSSIENKCKLESPGHINYDMIIKKYSSKFMDSHFKFAFVRNPFDRFVSAYHYLLQQDKNHRYWKYDKNISNKLKCINDFYSFCNIFLEDKEINTYHHFKPMHVFICQNDKIMVDFLGRYENLEEDFLMLIKKMNIENAHLEKKNTSKHLRWQDYYLENQFCIDLVKNFYEKDFEIFNYSKSISNDK